MSEEKLSKHAKAVNLARRYSVQNENDLMQENLYEDDIDLAPPAAPSKKKYDHATCEELSHHLLHPSALPTECKKYLDVVTYLKRHDTDTTHGSQILS